MTNTAEPAAGHLPHLVYSSTYILHDNHVKQSTYDGLWLLRKGLILLWCSVARKRLIYAHNVAYISILSQWESSERVVGPEQAGRRIFY